MRKIYWKLFLLVMAPFISFAQPVLKESGFKQGGYTVTGHIRGLEEGEKVILILLTYNTAERKDSAYVKNGEFHISGFVPEGPREYRVAFTRNLKEFDVHEYRGFSLAINNGEHITVTCDSDIAKINRGAIDEFVYKSNAATDRSLKSLLSAWYFYDRTLINLRKEAQKIVDSVGFDGAVLTGIFESIQSVHKAFLSDVFTNRPNQLETELSMAHLFLVKNVYASSGHAAFLVERYNEMPEKERSGYYGKMLREYITLCVGQPMPSFNLPTLEGKTLELKEVLSKSKVVVVNFWGTNSPLVKMKHDDLRRMYKLYHDKGLNIVAVSSDDYKEAWDEFLQKENYPWYNVLDKKGKIVDSVYNEYGVNPEKIRNVTNVVLDRQGKILAWDVSGAELQWYLWKNLKD